MLAACAYPGCPVHAHTTKGKWGYKEHDWEAGPGTYVFEPPGETHTLVVGEDEMIALFHVTGALLYCDPDDMDTVIGYDDVFTKLEKARRGSIAATPDGSMAMLSSGKLEARRSVDEYDEDGNMRRRSHRGEDHEAFGTTPRDLKDGPGRTRRFDPFIQDVGRMG